MTKISVDIAKATFTWAYRLPNGKFSVQTIPYTEAGIADFIGKLPADAHITMEHTGQYELRLAHALVNANFKVSIISGQKVKYYGKSRGFTNKTDKCDAKTILIYAEKEAELLRFYDIPPEDIAKMKQYRGLLEKINKDRQALVNQLDGHIQNPQADTYVTLSYERRIEQAEQEIKDLKDTIEAIVKTDKTYDKKTPMSVPGIGVKIAEEAIMFSKTFKDFDENHIPQMIKVIGLASSSNESGTSVRGSRQVAKGGYSTLKKALYMGAVSAVTRKKGTNVFKEQYLQLRANGKCFKVAITAIMTRMARVMFTLMTKGVVYDEAKHRLAAGK